MENFSNIMFVDAEDWIDKRMIETLYNKSMDSCLDITVCNTYKAFRSFLVVKKTIIVSILTRLKLTRKKKLRKN